jgi:hypothetical protein
MTANDMKPESSLGEGKSAIVETLQDDIGDNLRDVWVLDQRTQEPVYLRDDVAERVDDINVEKFLDNERYGFVTRQTYNLLHYSEFRYTHRGFDTWELFRTFVVDGDTQVGVLVGVDSDGTNYDFSGLTDEIHALADDYGVDSLVPVADGE